jgi:hypothetical protein
VPPLLTPISPNLFGRMAPRELITEGRGTPDP